MARRSLSVEELFDEVVTDVGWTKAKQIEILLGFIEEQELAHELEEYLRAVGDDDDTEDPDDEYVDPFGSDE